jgi:hypothetical protein
MSYTRISITLPRELAAAIQKQARALDRSRSWLVAEALRRYLQASAAQPARAVPEASPPPQAAGARGLGEHRLQQLRADLALTPEQRVLAGEQTARVAKRARPRPKAQRVLQFDRYQDYVEWKRREDLR